MDNAMPTNPINVNVEVIMNVYIVRSLLSVGWNQIIRYPKGFQTENEARKYIEDLYTANNAEQKEEYEIIAVPIQLSTNTNCELLFEEKQQKTISDV